MSAAPPHKVIRSYRLVFRRRWRIFRLQNWRIPLPNGLELRVLGYWLMSLFALLLLARLPLVGSALGDIPASLRLVALPIAAAWVLSRWEIDGRSPHRALLGIAGYWLRPRVLAGFRRCPPDGASLAPLERIVRSPDLFSSDYPRGSLVGPVCLLLRYPVKVKLEQVGMAAGASPAARMASARRWRLHSPEDSSPLHKGKVLNVPEGRRVIFE